MNTKNLTRSAILLAIGTILHYIVPGIIGGMKPDFLLLMMFLAILLDLNFKSALTVSVIAGVIAALTTTFPGGQIPSIIDKLISGLFVYYVAVLFTKQNKISSVFTAVISGIGTVISGVVFVGFALQIVGLPEGLSFTTMVLTVVLPTALITAFFSGALYGVLARAQKAIG